MYGRHEWTSASERFQNHGSALSLALLVMVVLTITGMALMTRTSGSVRQIQRELAYNKAYYLAESGLQRGFGCIYGGEPIPTSFTLDDLDPPNRVYVTFEKARQGSPVAIVATATAYGAPVDVSVTIRAGIFFSAAHR